MAVEIIAFRRRLLRWYANAQRPLPWRVEPDPWKTLVSEIMLQQTRVEAAIPFFHRFLQRFPTPRALAEASEPDVLATWSGLGYYSRARNLQRSARAIAERFPVTYEAIRELPGVGPYTAAAVASIAFGLPHAAVDGNVLRVIARLTGDPADIGSAVTRDRFTRAAQELLDPRRPGDFNQAMMELGATICLPRSPQCLLCPVARDCVARQEGRQRELPVKRAKTAPSPEILDVVVARRRGAVLLRQRGADVRRMAGFWDLPTLSEIDLPGEGEPAGSFRHTIVNTLYTVRVLRVTLAKAPPGMRWFPELQLGTIPLTTIARKALAKCPASLAASTE